MTTIKKPVNKYFKPKSRDSIGSLWEESWTYIKTVVDVVHQPVLILDKKLRVMSANESFYKIFQVEHKETISKVISELGNGQWNIPDLISQLEDIIPNNSFFKGFEVTHNFPKIGRKVFILNARQIHFSDDVSAREFPPIILMAMDDVTEMMLVAETVANHANKVSVDLTARAQKLDIHIKKLEKEIRELKNKPPASE